MGTPFSARGLITEARIPTSEKENGPSSLKQIQRFLTPTPLGRFSARHTIESSSAVRVTEVKGPLHAHSGTGESFGRRQMENGPGIQLNLSSIRFCGFPRLSSEIVDIGCASRFRTSLKQLPMAREKILGSEFRDEPLRACRSSVEQIQEIKLLFGWQERSFE